MKATIHEFDPVLYPRRLWVCLNATSKFLFDQFELNEERTDKTLERNGATTCSVVKVDNGYNGVLVYAKNKKHMTVKTIAHESVHVADCISEEIGAVGQNFTDSNEPYAYLVGWAAECIDEARKFKKKDPESLANRKY